MWAAVAAFGMVMSGASLVAMGRRPNPLRPWAVVAGIVCVVALLVRVAS